MTTRLIQEDCDGRSPPRSYVGLIGSKTKRARFLTRMRAAGLTEAMLHGLTCPIGIPGIKGKDPAVIAAATAAQLLMIAERTAVDIRVAEFATSHPEP